ncbi:MAG: CBS domain-containing protein [Anaerolineae bacterium]
MLVGERMTRNPITISETASIDDGLHLMRERKVRRLPVLDASGQMVGIVSDKDLLHAAPSPATSLSVYELHYLLSKLTIKQVMSRPVITVTPDTPLEEAARIMADNKIGGLPVVEGDKLVGIITETDIFKILLELLGARTAGLRATVEAPARKGVLAALTQALFERGADIVSIVNYAAPDPARARITVKMTGLDAQTVKDAVAQVGFTLTDLRSM